MSSSSHQVVRTEIEEVGFSLYTDAEVRALSVCKITSPVATDALGNVVQGGLEDPRLGLLDSKSGACMTCGLNYLNCPGHMGHIDLCVPVYHPMHFRAMFALLRSKCAFCHRLRMKASTVRHYKIRLQLLEMGDIAAARELTDISNNPLLFNEAEGKSPDNTFLDCSGEIESLLKRHEDRYEAYMGDDKRDLPDAAARSMQQEVVDEFYKCASAVKKCENDDCGCYSPAIRKDGYTKIFVRPLNKRLKRTMDARGKRYKSALEHTKLQEEGDLDNFIEDGVDISDDDDDDDENGGGMKESDKYMVPVEVQSQLKLLWNQSKEILTIIWKRALPRITSEYDISSVFFMNAILVLPSRFRPRSKLGETATEHPQNYHLSQIINHNESIANFVQRKRDIQADGEGESINDILSKQVTAWISLQNAVNCYMDSSKDPNPLGGAGGIPNGIKQILERKEGLFRKNMMGKRVNFCCRSVISPDPYMGTNEVGIPVKFAKELHYPTPVSTWNIKLMRELVERGPHQYPGANQIEMPDGKVISLANMSAQERAGKAKLLLSNPGVKVYRHLVNGDMLLVNRQPTLHKPGIMAHKARILQHVKEQTLRMNYANCSSYNADFDGDEMNCHFVQDELSRAESSIICNTDNQYIVPTSGNPLRGLIQDHVASGVKLTSKGTFLDREEFQQLLFIAVCGLPGTEVVTAMDKMSIPPPAILKPRKLWTGKQVITALLAQICRPPLPPLHLDGKTRTPVWAFGEENNEHQVIFRHGELLSGVMDKSSIGNSSLGIVHAVYELYGAELAGRILTAFGRLFTYYLQQAGHTCGIEDLILTSKAEKDRKKLLRKVEVETRKGLRSFLSGGGADSTGDEHEQLNDAEVKENEEMLGSMLTNDRKTGKAKIDGAMQGIINKSASEVIKVCLPNGLGSLFPHNNFSMMVLTGAKGSAVNQSQITCFLGQQALEGQRVPLMVSGKSLPSFKAFDSSARAGGFVQDRFLTGVKPQEYYFHCMAGREGLVDTAVKTSRSGYLQRCLVKHLEELKVNYDMTVRDSGGNIVQFLYGEDGLDCTSATLLGGKAAQLQFLARNHQAFVHKYSIYASFFEQGLDIESAKKHHDIMEKCKKSQEKSKSKEEDGKKKVDTFAKKSVVFVRRRRELSLGWIRSNLSRHWDLAEIVKVREGENGGFDRYDVRLFSDGSKIKKVPSHIPAGSLRADRKRHECSLVNDSTPLALIKESLPDPTLSLLNTDCVGSCSESIQDAIRLYTKTNPDGVISADTTDTTVAADAFELLVWIKYMRSLACPGEAVGCVAAQSIGEPSTQMTLNTFHLAGHGGANVTLGIPRLREIIMTASKTLKTPTMTVPLYKGVENSEALKLTRQLSRLPLSTLLHHKGGIQVREKLTKSSFGTWVRTYSIRFCFENLSKIFTAFGVTFRKIEMTIRNQLIKKLRYLINIEQRRAGEKQAQGRQEMVTMKSSSSHLSAHMDDKDTPGEGASDDYGMKSTPKKAKDAKSGNLNAMDSDDDDEDDEDDDDVEQGTLKLSGKKETSGYEDDDGENDDSNDESSTTARSKEDSDDDYIDDNDNNNDDDDDDESPTKKKISKNKGSPAATRRNIDNSSVATIQDGLITNEKEEWVELALSYPSKSRRLLMVQIAEDAANKTTVRETKDIANAYVVKTNVDGEDRIGIQTEGVNFEAIWDVAQSNDSIIDENHMRSNDTWKILQTYGIEAARTNIVLEINNVFGAYGINVNPRHLNLVADFMTKSGEYVAMNRMGMSDCSSPFLQMSFETTCQFLTTAAHEGRKDNMESPSARIVLGRTPTVGTGCFDVFMPLRDHHYHHGNKYDNDEDRPVKETEARGMEVMVH